MAFVGLGVSQRAKDQLSRIKLPGQNIHPHSYHCTLMYFGKQVLIEDIRKIIRVTTSVINKQKPFLVQTSLITKFSSKKEKYPIIAKLNGEHLLRMREALKKAYHKENINFNEKFANYQPHVTLSYADARIKFKDININPIAWTIKNINVWYKDGSESVKIELPFNK